MSTIRIDTTTPYEVMIGSGILKDLGEVIRREIPKAESAAVVTDTNVSGYYLQTALDSLNAAGLRAVSFELPAGEQSKNFAVYEEVLSFLAQERITRSDAVIALGGGVVGDLAGFAAATYLRGIACVQVPTSLLAMVDSSVGGKTAIDLPEGKNLVGAFYQPRAVLCDVKTLDTLPEDVFRDGCAEVIKYGILSSPELFMHLTKNGRGFDRISVIEECVRIKADVVAEDERDNGVRQTLNLGHTFGHAVEAESDYELSHGQAVAVGMAMIVRAGSRFGITGESCRDRVLECLKIFGLPVSVDKQASELLPYVMKDKKRRGSRINLIVPKDIGDCAIMPVSLDEAGDWMKAGCGE